MATRSAMPVVSTWPVICPDFIAFPLFHPTNIGYVATCLADAPGNPLPLFALELGSLVWGLIYTLSRFGAMFSGSRFKKNWQARVWGVEGGVFAVFALATTRPVHAR